MGCERCGASTPRPICVDCERLEMMEEAASDSIWHDCPECGDRQAASPDEPCPDCEEAAMAPAEDS